MIAGLTSEAADAPHLAVDAVVRGGGDGPAAARQEGEASKHTPKCWFGRARRWPPPMQASLQARAPTSQRPRRSTASAAGPHTPHAELEPAAPSHLMRYEGSMYFTSALSLKWDLNESRRYMPMSCDGGRRRGAVRKVSWPRLGTGREAGSVGVSACVCVP